MDSAGRNVNGAVVDWLDGPVVIEQVLAVNISQLSELGKLWRKNWRMFHPSNFQLTA